MTALDWTIVALYMGCVVGIGFWVGRHQSGMKDYFLGGKNIPWWAAALSMVATEISAATFLGAPEQGYTRDLTYLQFGMGSILARIALAFLFIGIYYRLQVYTVYEFLKHRFGMPTKNAAAGSFLLGRLFAGGSRLFIASLAIKVVTGFEMSTSILVLGILAIAYTFVGGIKAVIWTDVLQAIVLTGGALLSIYFLVQAVPMEVGAMIDELSAADKLRLFDTALVTQDGNSAIWSNAYHFFPAILGGFFLTMATHGTDQSMIQRLLTCKDSFRGKISMVLSGFVGIGVACLFIIVGLLMYLYVQHLPAEHQLADVAADLAAKGQNGNFYLHYIVQGLPAGISGLIIAAVISAAMSSVDSELNAMSATFLNDFYKPYFRPDADDSHYMNIAKIGTVVSGLGLVVLAILIADFYVDNPDTDLLSIALGVMTLFYGALLGVFLVGLLSRGRGSNLTCTIGMFLSTAVIVFISYKAKLLTGMGLVDPGNLGTGFADWLYQMQLSWPWFIVLGTAITVVIALLGRTTANMMTSYNKLKQDMLNPTTIPQERERFTTTHSSSTSSVQ